MTQPASVSVRASSIWRTRRGENEEETRSDECAATRALTLEFFSRIYSFFVDYSLLTGKSRLWKEEARNGFWRDETKPQLELERERADAGSSPSHTR